MTSEHLNMYIFIVSFSLCPILCCCSLSSLIFLLTSSIISELKSDEDVHKYPHLFFTLLELLLIVSSLDMIVFVS